MAFGLLESCRTCAANSAQVMSASRAAICACLATGLCVGSVTLELWVMRGTCFWSALLLQISETSTLHWLQSAQVSWLIGIPSWLPGMSEFPFLSLMRAV